MREIKFRAYDPVLGMCEVKSIDFDSQTLWVSKDNTLYELSFENSPPIEYTGIKDKKGREIYKGDIIKWEVVGSHAPWKEIFEVKIPEIYYAEASENWPGGLEEKDCEILGNIYENPELAPSEEEK